VGNLRIEAAKIQSRLFDYTRMVLVAVDSTLRQQGLDADADDIAMRLCWLTARDDSALSNNQREIRDAVKELCPAD
jgi:hypothetical protein